MRRVFLVLALLALPTAAFAQQAETIEYYGTDAIGSIRIVWDASGNVTARMDYTPFGEPVLQQGTAIPKEGFVGNETDAETNQDYFHARLLEARTGRFTRTDPIEDGVGDPQAWNRYAYALNNPVTATDAAGLDVSLSPGALAEIAHDLECQQAGVFCANSNDPSGGAAGGGDAGDGFIIVFEAAGPSTIDQSTDNGAFGGTSIGPLTPPTVIGPISSPVIGPIARPVIGPAVVSQNAVTTNPPYQHWWQSCGAKALGSFAWDGGVDALAFIPGEKVAALGIGATKAGFETVSEGLSLLNTAAHSDNPTTIETAAADATLNLAGRNAKTVGKLIGKDISKALPVIGVFATAASVIDDARTSYESYTQCSARN